MVDSQVYCAEDAKKSGLSWMSLVILQNPAYRNASVMCALSLNNAVFAQTPPDFRLTMIFTLRSDADKGIRLHNA